MPESIQNSQTNTARRLVVVPTPKTLIKESPGFAKKHLSNFKIDLLALCEFGCRCCSSNTGNYLRINRGRFADLTEEQLGTRDLPGEDPSLVFSFQNVVDQLDRELSPKRRGWGAGSTLVFSMLTDGFSPHLVANGVTRAALELLVEKTSFRIRVLTKNAVVGSSDWIEFFLKHKDRFVVGLSTGTLDDAWAAKVEIGTSPPTERLHALKALQDAGVPTYGVACPIFPSVVSTGKLHDLIDAIDPGKVETLWTEPYNDRVNWQHVQAGHDVGSDEYAWFAKVFEERDRAEWSRYATDLYVQMRLRAQAEGWLPKLKFMLYESGIVAEHAREYCSMDGLLLQSPSDAGGRSTNPHIRAVQDAIGVPTAFDRLASRYEMIDAAGEEASDDDDSE